MRKRLGQFWMVASLVLLFQSGVVPAALASGELPPLEVVQELDLQRYLGKWYEIAAISQNFQRNCVATTATYRLRSDGNIDVLNECRKFQFDGKLDRAHGKAWIPNPEQPAKLLVQFFWPFRGDYWVIELGDNYEYAVVGHPSRNYLWILSRTPQMDPRKVEEIYGRLSKVGYDLSRIQATLQPSSAE